VSMFQIREFEPSDNMFMTPGAMATFYEKYRSAGEVHKYYGESFQL
jgi:hypothetical protein